MKISDLRETFLYGLAFLVCFLLARNSVPFDEFIFPIVESFKFTTQHQDVITKAFKRCGMFNDIHGSENYLVKIERLENYTPPGEDDSLEIVQKTKPKRKAEPATIRGKKKQKIQ